MCGATGESIRTVHAGQVSGVVVRFVLDIQLHEVCEVGQGEGLLIRRSHRPHFQTDRIAKLTRR